MKDKLPAASNITVKISNVINPTVSGTTEKTFTGFGISSTYDGGETAKTDATNVSRSITILKKPETMHVTSSTFYPQNQAEYATYEFTIQLNADLKANKNARLTIKFPTDYSSDMLDKARLVCTSELQTLEPCTQYEPREVRFDQFTEDVDGNKKYSFTVFGITNPPAGTTGTLSFYLTDLDTENVLSYLEDAVGFIVKDPPKLLTMTHLHVDNQHLNDVGTYEFGFKTGSEKVIVEDKIWLDWPNEYYGLFY